MWPFRKVVQPRTVFYDPEINAVVDPAVREWLSRILGLVNQLDSRIALAENNLYEIRERLTWTVQQEGSPFTEGDRVARSLERRATDGIERADRHSREAPEGGGSL